MKIHRKPIDIVVPWVDGSDPEWIKIRNEYAKKENIPSVIDISDERYRDWDTIRYFFRSVEKYMPWVRKVHFITCGQVPKWMNLDAPKLHWVKHEDYIPEKYLPTFSSHTIELNMHKIEGLAEQFIYFNDDMIAASMCKPEDFFKNGLPRDFAILGPMIATHRNSTYDIVLSDIEIINDHFKKNSIIKKNFFKWFNPVYGKHNLKSMLLMPWERFSTIYDRHVIKSYLKSTFNEVWEKEYEVLDSTSSHHFRTKRDVNQYIFRFWQICTGKFVPIKPERVGKYLFVKDDNSHIRDAFKSGKYCTICINDLSVTKNEEAAFENLKAVLEEVFPEKSSFEK